jgi:hypothetical protein
MPNVAHVPHRLFGDSAAQRLTMRPYTHPGRGGKRGGGYLEQSNVCNTASFDAPQEAAPWSDRLRARLRAGGRPTAPQR